MNTFRAKSSSYLLVFLLPLAIVVLLAGGLSLASFYKLKQDHLAVRTQQMQDIGKIAAVTQFNQDVAAIQHLVTDTLEQAKAGKLDEAGIYRVHSQVVNQLAELERRLPELQAVEGDANLHETQLDFQAYRNFIIQATDLAAIDPPMAMNNAYSAANRYLFLSEHTRDIAKSVTDKALMRSEAQKQLLAQHAMQNAVIGGMLVIGLMLIGFILAQKLTRRLSALGSTLEGLANGDVNPQTLPAVRIIADEKRSMLRDLARAALTFRQTSIGHRTAQYDLGERMKECYRARKAGESAFAPK